MHRSLLLYNMYYIDYRCNYSERYVYVELCLYVWPSQPGKVVNPARGQQLNRENELFVSSSFAPKNMVTRDGFGGPISRQLAHLRTPG